MHLVHILFESNPVGLLLEDSVSDTTRMLHPVCQLGALISLDIRDA
jgi:hypothetical protein